MTTNLYVKINSNTGLKYFGKTIRNPHKYNGSGKYWRNHCNTHGWDIETYWTKEFADIEECKQFAMAFSEIFDIVASDEWANYIDETGVGGVAKGRPNTWTKAGWHHSEETKQKIKAKRALQTNIRKGPLALSSIEKMKATKAARKLAGIKKQPWTAERRAKVAATWASKLNK